MHHPLRPRSPAPLMAAHRKFRPTGRTSAEAAGGAVEQAVLVGVLLPDMKADPRDPLGELASLAASAGVEAADSLVQKRLRLSASTGLGRGKLAELVERVEAVHADVVIFDNDLAPRQIRAVERAVSCKVIDRSELILDIFATRAKTHEAQLQVELAQLEYTAPRLRGMWTHLERIAGAGGATGAGVVGGVGTRGPGERQIEIDRRIVRDRISYLRRQLKQIDQRKQREVESRSDQFTVSLVGYTNSGKTTLMNRLTGVEQFAADMLFATLDTKTVRWFPGDGRPALLSDTVGFVRDIPHGLVASFRATLEETIHADLLLHVVDASSPMALQQMESVDHVLAEIGCADAQQIIILNKMDVAQDAGTAEILTLRHQTSLQISAKTGAGIDALAAAVAERVQGDLADVIVSVPQSEGKLLAELDRDAEIRDRQYAESHVRLSLRINRGRLDQFLGRNKNLLVIRDDKEDGPSTDELDGLRGST